MKDIKKVIEGLKCCLKEDACSECPYDKECEGCTTLKLKAIELLEKLAERSTTACDYELTFKAYDAEIRKLNDELSRVNAEYERTECELHRAEVELIHLRTVKATAEAFLGVKIDGQM